MTQYDSVVAVYDDHLAADAGVRKLVDGGFELNNFSLVGKGYHTDEKILGFYTTGDRMKLWGKYGAFWGALWGLFFSGVFLTIPVIGPIVALGPLAVTMVSAVEGAIAVGGFSALGAALFSMGLSKDSVVHYESAIKADGFLVVGHGSQDEMARAKATLASTHPKRLDLHGGLSAVPMEGSRTMAAAT